MRMRASIGSWALALAVALIGSGCSAVNDFGRFMFGDSDGGMQDAGMDDAGMPDAGQDAGPQDGGMIDAGDQDGGPTDGGTRPPPTGIIQTSGGAVLMNSEYRLRISVGAPQPMGSRSDSSHRLRVGPVPQ